MANKIFTDESLATFVDEIKSYTDEKVSGAASANHSHSFNDLEDKPFYDETVTYFEFDGNTDGLDTVEANSIVCYKVSDTTLSKDQLVGSLLDFYDSSGAETNTGYEIVEDDVYYAADNCIATLGLYIVTEGTWSGLSKGVWVMSNADCSYYTSKIYKSSTKTLDPKYLPDNVINTEADWNSLLNKPFYDNTEVLLEWNGNTDGLESIDMSSVGSDTSGVILYKISDTVINKESLIGSSVTTTVVSTGAVNSGTVTESDIQEQAGCVVIPYTALFYYETVVNGDITITPGVWVYAPSLYDVYLTSLSKSNIKTLDSKYLPENVINTEADWNSLLNKPFYYNEGTTILEPQDFTLEWDEATCYYSGFNFDGNINLDISVGDILNVNWNGNIYECTVEELDNGYYAFGDIYNMTATEPIVNPNMPFAIAYEPNDHYLLIGDYASYSPDVTPEETTEVISIGITTAGELKQLDSKFIPDHSHSFNDLEDKPFYDNTVTYFEWDGSTEGLESVTDNTETTYYKISDIPLTQDQILGSSYELIDINNGNEVLESGVITSDMNEFYVSSSGNVIMALTVVSVLADEVCNEASFTTGLWVCTYGGIHVPSLSKSDLKQLDPKFIPDHSHAIPSYSDSTVVIESTDGLSYTATVDGITELKVGTRFTIIPNTTSTATGLNLDVNGLGSKPLRQRLSTNTSIAVTAATESWLVANKPATVMYDGTRWIVEIARPDASNIYGTVAIENGGTGASTAESALANLGAFPVAGGTITGETTFSGGLIRTGSDSTQTVYNNGTQIIFGSNNIPTRIAGSAITSTKTITADSDARLKNIYDIDLDSMRNFAKQIKLVAYSLISDPTNDKRIGVVAQQLLEIDEEIASYFVKEGENGYYSVDYTGLALMIAICSL